MIEQDGRVIVEALTNDVRELKGMLFKPKKVATKKSESTFGYSKIGRHIFLS